MFDRFDFNTAESYIKRNNLIYFAILFDGHQQFVQIRMFGCPCIDICQLLIERKCTYFVRWDIGGLLFKFFFTHGFVLDTLLSWVGFNVDKLPFWLRDESINNVVLVACSIWKYIGQNIVMFIGAIASVDPVLYEAAEIDGANAWHRFKDIILPSISTIVVLNLIISVSGALSAFEMPYVVTGGGFNTSTYFVVMDKIAHTDQKVGLASAMAVVLLLLIVIVTYAQKAVEKWLENRSSGVTK